MKRDVQFAASVRRLTQLRFKRREQQAPRVDSAHLRSAQEDVSVSLPQLRMQSEKARSRCAPCALSRSGQFAFSNCKLTHCFFVKYFATVGGAIPVEQYDRKGVWLLESSLETSFCLQERNHRNQFVLEVLTIEFKFICCLGTSCIPATDKSVRIQSKPKLFA